MSDSDDDFFDALEYIEPQKEKHYDIPDARQISASNSVQNVEGETFKKKFAIATTQDMSEFEYNMNHKHRGVAIIFNHCEYNDSSLEKRTGTEKDVEALQNSLPLLGFEPENIIVENDLTRLNILNYSYRISATKSEVLQNSDCIAIFILSHGSKGNMIYARDGDYDLYKVVEQYTPNNFPDLAAKPKLFFVNACRGKNIDDGVQLLTRKRASNIVTDSADSVSDQMVFSHPIYADILVSLSSHHEHISFRNVEGSWFIQDFCNAINKYNAQGKVDTVDITEMLLYTHFLVSQRVSTSDSQQLSEKKQIPNFNSALCRKLFFKAKKN